ncbi:MAG: cytochrome P450 [Anaerolineae bacterium]|nr:cytochrome P450 [Anaerolineae bacterium]
MIRTESATAATAIPGLPPVPILGWRGNMLRFFRDPLTYLKQSQRTYGNVVAFAHGGNGNLLATVEDCPGTVFAFGEANNQAILTKTDVFQSSPMSSTQLGHAPTTRLLSGIFSMNGTKHRQQRRLMMPAFHKKRIEGYLTDMAAMTELLLTRWQPGSQTDFHQDMMELTLQIACKTLFGVDILHGDQNIGAMIQNWIKSNLNPLIMARVDLPGTPYRRFTRLSTELDSAMRAILDRKRASGVDEGDVLSMLIQSRDENGEQMTEDELVGQANILFFAGHETTANTLTWTIFLLACHPEIYTKVLEELDTKLGGATPTIDQLASLELLDRVIKESMRILPPVPFLLRVAMEDTDLGGYRIGRGSEVIYSPFITHHSPDLYPEPERFNPDRWLTIDPSPYAYIPFGAGLRMCIGAPFALMEAKLVLAMMLQRYRLTLADTKVDREVMITMSPKGGMRVLVQPQDKRPIDAPPAIQGTIRELVELP